MNIRVLGCSGAAFPGHHSPGFLLDQRILFDAGSVTDVLDEAAQMKIKHIFITHAHLDHIVGIPFLADNILHARRAHQVYVFSIPSVIKTIKTHLLNRAIWPDFTLIPNSKRAILNLVPQKPGQPIQIDSYTITPYAVNHSVPAVGYLIEDQRRRRWFYTGDTGPSGATWKKLEDRPLHGLTIEVSLPNRMRNLAIKTGHLTPRLLAIELSKMARWPERIYVTHPKVQFVNTIKQELERLHFKNLILLREGDSIHL